VRVSRLGNGMRVVTDSMESIETASIGVWVGVGTRHEPAEVNGVAHMLEHMAFKGTERRSSLAIAKEIEAVGGHVNAYTSREQTAYYAKVLAGDVPLALDILADILQHSVFDPAELERERQVILQEIGQAEDTPDDIVFDYFQECAFPDQGMGRPVLGRAEIIRRLDRGTIAGYMHRHYGAGRMVLVAAGKVDHDQVVSLAERRFTALPELADTRADAPRYKGGDLRKVRDLEQVHVVLGFPGVAFGDPDYHALSVLSAAFGGGMSSRLFQEIREKRGLVYSIYSFVHAYSDSGLFGIYAGTGEAEVAELVPALCEEVRRMPEGLDAEEIERARAQLKAGLLMGLESTSGRAEQQAHHMLLFGRPFDAREIVEKIDAVDAAAVIRAARRIGPGPLTLTALGPIDRLEDYRRVMSRLAA
ncbi:MAG TPA: pitrilysin family protein, partial [Stellaceae bacterium]|nr:pitrilysin family protein [Stellaceae bacterium]